MKKILIITLVIATLPFLSCYAQQKVSGNYTYSIQCLGTELDGSHTMKAWGNGRNRFDATEQAKKNAVYAVIFDGIREGQGGCDVKPLVNEVNAKEKYEDYFNKFFSDKGEYLNYVSLKDERIGHKVKREKKGAVGGKATSAIVRVLKPQLKQKLINDNIIKN